MLNPMTLRPSVYFHASYEYSQTPNFLHIALANHPRFTLHCCSQLNIPLHLNVNPTMLTDLPASYP